MENQGDSNKNGDDGYGKGSKDGENKPKPCPCCSGTCQGANCSQFPSLQVGVRQARVPRRLRNAMIPKLKESSEVGSSSSYGTEHPLVNQVEGAEQASSVPSEPKKYDLYTPPVEKVEELSIPKFKESSEAASSSSHGMEHPLVNQVEGAEQASSVLSEPKKYDLYTPPVEKVEELSEKPADLKEMELYVDNLLSAMEELSNLQRPSSSSHSTRFLAVNKADGKERPSSLRPSSLPYVPLKKHLPPLPVQDPPALVSTTPNTTLPPSDSLGLPEKKLISEEEFEHYLYNTAQAEFAELSYPWHVSSLGSSLPSDGTMHPSLNQVEGSQAASPLPSQHPSLNQVEATQAASPLPSEHPFLNQVEAAQAATSSQPELYYGLGPPVKIVSTTPYQPDLYYGPGSPVKKDEVNVDHLNCLLEATFPGYLGTGYYSPYKPPLPRPPVRGTSSSHGARRPPLPPPFHPSPSQFAETRLTTNPTAILPTSNWTPQDVPTDSEELRRVFDHVLSTSVSGRWFPPSEKSPEKNDRRPY